jgi:hypothetical protein
MITLVVCKARCAFETARVARVLIGLVGKLTIQHLQPGPGDNINARCCRSGGGQRYGLAQVLCCTSGRSI